MQEQGLFQELLKRRIWRVFIAYPLLAFGLLEAFAFFVDIYDLGPRALTAGFILAVLLFPAAMLWNWRFGESGAQSVLKSEVLAYVLPAALAVSAAGLWLWRAAPSSEPRESAAKPPSCTALPSSLCKMWMTPKVCHEGWLFYCRSVKRPIALDFRLAFPNRLSFHVSIAVTALPGFRIPSCHGPIHGRGERRVRLDHADGAPAG